MSQEQSTMHTEDIELDETGAEAVIGGANAHKSSMTMAQAVKAGYKPIACVVGGDTLMKNKAGREILIK
jgi:hypothetical protein